MLQFNYMVELSWLMSHLPNKTIPVTFVHGFRGESLDYLREEASHFPNVRLVIPNLPIAYGTHHTKMMCLFYVDGDAQVIIHTANMISRDWGNKTQGMWVSPMLHRKLGTGSCQFESDFSEYLAAYGSSMRHWRERLQTYDYTQCKATLVASVPGRHTGNDMYKWGHLKLRRSLEKVSIPEALRAKSLLIAQFSSVGSLGTSDEWLMQELGNSLSACRNKQLGSNLPMKLIFPTIDNVRTSLEGWAGGGSLPFDTKNWVKQESYMRPRLCVWEANEAGRPRAVPHIKTYTRIDPESGEMGWFLLSSSNLSKAAWGSVEKKGTQIMIRSYELGVLIVSDDFKTDSTQKAVLQAVTVAGLATIHPKDSPSPTDASLVVPIRLPYDIPLTPYKPHDVPWTKDSLDESLASKRDTFGFFLKNGGLVK
ncbi:tyrosyl-DNA phosphodiesterase I [Powellomyces hirtus]|nr:tyrosyl-DNA phosphodiesterase I [Powellomyces hirtus]